MNNKFFLSLCTVFLTCISLIAAPEISPRKCVFHASPSVKPPIVDGRIGADEYAGAFESFGMLNWNSPMLAKRQGSFYMALDANYLYLACKSELPPDGMKLKNRRKRRDGEIFKDDSVEFLIYPPKGNALYHLILNPSGKSYDVAYPVKSGGVTLSQKQPWDPNLTVVSKQENGFWTLEVKIPLKEFGVANAEFPATYLMQFARSWKQPEKQTQLNQAHVYASLEEMNSIEFSTGLPVVRFTSMGDYRNGNNQLRFMVDNPTDAPRKVAYRITVKSEAAPRSKDGSLTIPAKTTLPVELNYTEKSKLSSDLAAVFTDESTGKILYQKTFLWESPTQPEWAAKQKTSGAEIEFGVYPYWNKLRARLGNKSIPIDLRKTAKVTFQICHKDGKPTGKAVDGIREEGAGYTVELPLDLTEKDDYLLKAVIVGIDGKTTEKTVSFKFEKFPWEHNKLGITGKVLVPYKDLVVEGNTVKLLMGEYQFKNGLPCAVRMGKAKNLLAAPITLSINGTALTETGFRWTEKAADICVNDTQLTSPTANVTIRNAVEFDNFIKTTVTVTPKQNAKFDSMTLEIPMKTEYAQTFHSVCNAMRYNPTNRLPEKEGVLWTTKNSKGNPAVSNNFRPYIWIGNMGEGMAFFAESDRNWSRDPEKPMAEIIRKGDTTTLVIHLADKKFVPKAPFELVFGFQATPTRTRPSATRQLTERFKCVNSTCLSLLAGGACWSCDDYDFFPKNHDYTYINALCKAKNQPYQKANDEYCEGYLKKHFMSYPKDRQKSFLNHLKRGFAYANMSTLLVPYMNSRASQLRWPEYNVFMDEWFCSEFRANNEDDYNNSPVPSYQDYLLYCSRKLVQEGLDGIYYDNIRDWHNTNRVTGPSYELPNGKIQPYFDIFDMRNLIKRTALMLQEEGKTFYDGRPVFILHMTNTNIIPFISLGSVGLDMEAQFGSLDFQERFSEDYIRICTLGLQTGIIPEILIQIHGNEKERVTRTFLAVTLAYDLPMVLNVGGPTSIWGKTWRALKQYGYGLDSVKVLPCFADGHKVTCAAPAVRITEYRKSDETVAAVCSFGAVGPVKVQLPADTVSAKNFETGEALAVAADKTIMVELKKNDFQLIQFSK